MRKYEPLMPSRMMAEDGAGYLFIVVGEGNSHSQSLLPGVLTDDE
jgi:hypothetical protein